MNFYTEKEVAKHCYPDDCWLIIHGKVFDVTQLITENRGNELTVPLIKYAGKSVSHWFNKKTGDLKMYMDPEREETELPYVPDGRFLHVPPKDPKYFEIMQLPWWKNEAYYVGLITANQRSVKILNVLNQQEDIIDICCEDKISKIQNRYLEYNKHSGSYTWKALVKDKVINLNMNATLDENGISDESQSFENVGLEYDFYLPTLMIYFNDDLTNE